MINLTFKRRSFWELLVDFTIVLYLVGLFCRFSQIDFYLWRGINLLVIVVQITNALYIYKGKIKIGTYILWGLFFLTYATLSSIWALDTQLSVNAVIELFFTILIGFSFYFYIDNQKKLEKFIQYFIFSTLFMIVYVLIVYQGANIFEGRFGSSLRMIDDGFNSNFLGAVLGFSYLFSLYFLLEKKKAINFILILILAFFALMTGSKKVMITIILGTIFFIIYRAKSSSKIIYFFIGIIVIYIGYYLTMNVPIIYQTLGIRIEYFLSYFTNSGGYVDESTRLRMHMVSAGIEFFKERPLHGYGLDNYRVLLNHNYGIDAYAHNNYIELLVGQGIIGLFIFYYIYIYILFNLRKLLQSNKSSLLILFATIVILIMINDLGSVSYADKTVFIFFAVICAYIRIFPKHNKKLK